MINLLETYDANELTITLIPSFHTDYQTIVWEQDQTLYVKQTPLQIIRSSCLASGASYDGRRDAVIHITGLKKKVPIPINLVKRIFAFPSHSGNHPDCHWLFFNHIGTIREIPPNLSSSHHSVVIFKNGQQLLMKETVHVLKMQLYRTSECIRNFSPTVVR
ncbi:competence protein ComK [Aquibacillus salsiterrae]|uniref:Competence protein ComK n=1 Tax=Aquibacillus salsiterrae TaxID=2950439 RepID=A0A9X3WAU6_9BACI|nr:competence protein ComK [Aquibacillus salsiterrae]MDC3415952.1 competence protein ComK [Aquibacillus salsiterrae]